MNKICICGHFANKIKSYNGQTIKTNNIFLELKKKYGQNQIICIDTYNWKKKPLKLLKECFEVSKNCNNIIILPAHKGVKIFVPLFTYLKKKFNFKLHYVVIGGWLPSLVENSNFMKSKLKEIDFIYIENKKTATKLNELGINNVYQMNNFKNLKISDHKYKLKKGMIKCCIFSRIEEKKGINDAIDIILKINKYSKTKVILDIFGKIEDSYKNIFYSKIHDKENTINYRGIIEPNDSVNTIEKYDLLLFPTKYYTEGIPGTIIDAYFSGTPILASKWENFDELIIEGKTGISYEFNNNDDFYDKLKSIVDNNEILIKMSKNCKKEATKYLPENSMQILYKNME